MKRITFLALLLLSGRCLAQRPDFPVDLGTSTDPDGMSRAYTVSNAWLEKTPAWAPEQGPVPLSMERALAISKQWLAKQNPKFEGFVPTHFTLTSACQTAGRRYWVWQLQFEPVLGGRTLSGPSFEAFVLLDGSVVEPRVSKGPPLSER